MPKSEAESVASRYPNIDAWVKDGLIEIGRCDYSGSFVRALDEGGMIWEGAKRYASLDAALKDLDQGIAKWIEEN